MKLQHVLILNVFVTFDKNEQQSVVTYNL
jgi:hypothetical protein